MARTGMTFEEVQGQAREIGWRAAKAMRAENAADPRAAAREVSRWAQDAETTAAVRVLEGLS